MTAFSFLSDHRNNDSLPDKLAADKIPFFTAVRSYSRLSGQSGRFHGELLSNLILSVVDKYLRRRIRLFDPFQKSIFVSVTAESVYSGYLSIDLDILAEEFY